MFPLNKTSGEVLILLNLAKLQDTARLNHKNLLTVLKTNGSLFHKAGAATVVALFLVLSFSSKLK